jgi:hypothetical protein
VVNEKSGMVEIAGGRDLIALALNRMGARRPAQGPPEPAEYAEGSPVISSDLQGRATDQNG